MASRLRAVRTGFRKAHTYFIVCQHRQHYVHALVLCVTILRLPTTCCMHASEVHSPKDIFECHRIGRFIGIRQTDHVQARERTGHALPAHRLGPVFRIPLRSRRNPGMDETVRTKPGGFAVSLFPPAGSPFTRAQCMRYPATSYSDPQEAAKAKPESHLPTGRVSNRYSFNLTQENLLCRLKCRITRRPFRNQG